MACTSGADVLHWGEKLQACCNVEDKCNVHKLAIIWLAGGYYLFRNLGTSSVQLVIDLCLSSHWHGLYTSLCYTEHEI